MNNTQISRQSNNIMQKRQQIKFKPTIKQGSSKKNLSHQKAINKQVAQSMSNQDQSQNMLQELRNLLVSHTHLDRNQIVPTDEQTNKYLTESYKIVQAQMLNRDDPNLIHTKISQASVLLHNQSPMIKNYIKSKIQSQFFANKMRNQENQKGEPSEGKKIKSNSEQYYKLLQIREQLERKRLQQKIEQNKKIQKMIQSTRKYRRYQLQSQIPLPQLQSIVQKQKQDFDSIQKQEHRLTSINNLLQFQGFKGESNYNDVYFGETRYGSKKNIKNKNSNKQIKQEMQELNIQDKNKISQNYIIQVQGIQENQQGLISDMALQFSKRLDEKLQKNKRFVKVFSAFLQLQYKKIENELKGIKNNETQNLQLNIQSSQIKKKRFKFPDLLSKQKVQTKIQVPLSQLSRTYKFRAFAQQKQEIQGKVNIAPVKKVVSKRIGESAKFHNKQCQIQNLTFYYVDDNGESHKRSDMKSFQLALQPVEIKTQKKEQGSIFQKKQVEIQTAIVKGKQRNFAYEYSAAQGVQLTYQINRINLMRYHRISCLLNANNNKNMQKFIEGEHTTLDLSYRYIRFDEQFTFKNYRNNFIKMLKQIFPLRKSTHIINLQRCLLSFSQINGILKKCEQEFSTISEINISKTKLDKQTLKNVLSLTKKCSQSSTINLNLNSCELDDSIIESNLSNFENSCPKIGKLIMSNNYITSKSVKLLKDVFSSKVCQLKTLSLSGCPIENFQQVSDLIKTSNKLQTLHLNKCNLTINNYNQMQALMLATQQKQQFKKLQLMRNQFVGNIKWFQQISSYLQLKIDLNLKNSSKNLQSKYLRIIIDSNKSANKSISSWEIDRQS